MIEKTGNPAPTTSPRGGDCLAAYTRQQAAPPQPLVRMRCRGELADRSYDPAKRRQGTPWGKPESSVTPKRRDQVFDETACCSKQARAEDEICARPCAAAAPHLHSYQSPPAVPSTSSLTAMANTSSSSTSSTRMGNGFSIASVVSLSARSACSFGPSRIISS